MFCRFCGARLLADSVFCSRCGKRLGDEAVQPESKAGLVARLHLKTPYPWAGLLFAAFLLWTVWPESAGPDLSSVVMELEIQGETDGAADNTFRHYLSLVVENQGSEPVREIPVEFSATIAPAQDAEVVSEFRGGRFVVLRDEEAVPLILVLTDEIAASAKRRFPIDSVVTTMPPAEVTYTVRSRASGEVLAMVAASLGKVDSL